MLLLLSAQTTKYAANYISIVTIYAAILDIYNTERSA